MPRLFNPSLVTFRNFAVIAAFAIVAHIVAKPLFNAVDGDPNT